MHNCSHVHAELMINIDATISNIDKNIDHLYVLCDHPGYSLSIGDGQRYRVVLRVAKCMRYYWVGSILRSCDGMTNFSPEPSVVYYLREIGRASCRERV